MLSGSLEGGMGAGGREVREGGDICIPMTGHANVWQNQYNIIKKPYSD